MGAPLVFTCIIITFLAIPQLTYQGAIDAEASDTLKTQKQSNISEHIIEENKKDLGSDAQSGTKLCPSSTKIIYPRTMKSTDGASEYVVNTQENKQGILVEICMPTEGSCNIPGTLFPGYTSRCVQRYGRLSLMVFNTNSSTPLNPKSFEFPLFCSCEIVRTPTK